MIKNFLAKTPRLKKIFLIFATFFVIFITLKLVNGFRIKRELTKALQLSKNYSPENISATIYSQYNDTVTLLSNELEDWDKNFLITSISIGFGSESKHLGEMYATGAVKSYTSIWVYSPAHRTTRMFEVGSKGIVQRGEEQDWSMYDNKERDWPSSKRLPSPDIGTAVEKCLDYAEQKGNYYLRDCDNGIDTYGGKYFGWNCEFLQVELAIKTKYLFEFDFEPEGSYLCHFNSETQEVENWLKKLPPP